LNFVAGLKFPSFKVFAHNIVQFSYYYTIYANKNFCNIKAILIASETTTTSVSRNKAYAHSKTNFNRINRVIKTYLYCVKLVSFDLY
jgi:hypothetical protein